MFDDTIWWMINLMIPLEKLKIPELKSQVREAIDICVCLFNS